MNPSAITTPGGPELLLIGGIIVLIFGARKLPEIGKGLGEGIKEFKNAAKQAKEEDVAEKEDDAKSDS